MAEIMSTETPTREGNGSKGQSDPFPTQSFPVQQVVPLSAARSSTRMKAGRLREIPRDRVRQIVLQYIAARDGVDVLDLLDRAEVHFLDENDRDVALDAIAITWDE